MDDDDVNIKLAPGTYTLSAADVSSGAWPAFPAGVYTSSPIFLFSGSNSTYDFTDVSIILDIDILSAYGNRPYTWYIVGNDNTMKNLTLDYNGSVYDETTFGAITMVMDGQRNTVEGFDISTKGSYPYGYGDAFGKGTSPLIPLKKHSGILIRGNNNTLRNTNLYHRGFGHCVVFQGAQNPLVEGCSIEAELRSTDDMLTETSGPAFDLDFMTRYGIRLPSGYMKSLAEDGLRAYSDGNPVIDGVLMSGYNTTNITLKNNIVKHARNGCHMTFAGGTTHIENITLVGCELGFSPGNNALINCSADCTYGPAYYNHYSNGSNAVTGDLTILEPVGPYLNGNGVAAFFGGSGNANLNLHGDLNGIESGLVIKVGGNTGNLFDIGAADQSGTNKKINNYTNFPIVINSTGTNNTIETCGRVEDYGTNNTVTASDNCNGDIPCVNTFDNLQAECYSTMSGVEVQEIAGMINEKGVFYIENNDWISFGGIDLNGVTSVSITAASTEDGTAVEVRTGSSDGTLLATVPVSNTSGSDTYQISSADLTQTVDGEIDVFFVFTGGSGSLFNLDKISFVQDACFSVSYSGGATISAADFCASSGVTVVQSSASIDVVSEIDQGDYIRFSNLDVGDGRNYNAFQFSVASAGSNGTIEVRSGAVDGTLLTSVNVESTGDLDTYALVDAYLTDEINGIQDLYIVFVGGGGSLLNLESFQVYRDECVDVILGDTQINAEDFCDNTGAAVRSASEGGFYVGPIVDGETYGYGIYDFDNNSFNTFEVGVGKSSFKENFVELRLDNAAGRLIATIDISETTGGSQVWKGVSTSAIEPVTGVHKLYLVFTGTPDLSLVNFNWFRLYDKDFCIGNLIAETGLNAENYCSKSGGTVTNGAQSGQYMGTLEAGDHISYGQFDFDDTLVNAFEVAYGKPLAVDAQIEIRLDSEAGTKIGQLDISESTGGDEAWMNTMTRLIEVSGEHEVFIVMTGEQGVSLGNINSIKLFEADFCTNTLVAEEALNAEFYCSKSGGTVEDASTGGQYMANIGSGDHFSYGIFNFDGSSANNFEISYGALSATDMQIEVRLDSATGIVVGEIDASSTTGDAQVWETVGTRIEEISGSHEVFIVFTGSNTAKVSFDWIRLFEVDYCTGALVAEEALEAELYCSKSGGALDESEGVKYMSANAGDYFSYGSFDFDLASVNAIEITYEMLSTADAKVEIRLGSSTGRLIGELDVEVSSGGFETWETQTTRLNQVSGTYEVYLIVIGEGTTSLINLDWLKLYEEDVCTNEEFADVEINAEYYCSGVGGEIKNFNADDQYVGNVESGNYFNYGMFDFGTASIESFAVSYGKAFGTEAAVEVRLDSHTGTLLGTVDLTESTGGSQLWQTKSSNLDDVSGEHEVYLVFTGQQNTALLNFDWFKLSENNIATVLGRVELSELIRVGPNPTQGSLFIDLSNHMGSSVEYFINSIEGKQLKAGTWKSGHQNRVELELNSLSSGVYLLNMQPLGSPRTTIRFVVFGY